MACRILTRSFLSSSKQTFDSIFARSLTTLSKPSTQSLFNPSLSLIRLRPLIAVGSAFRNVSPPLGSMRGFSTRQSTSSLNDPNPNWSNRPPKETILLDGCDFEHWLVVMEKPDESWTRDQIIDSYIKVLAQIVGSEEEARMKIYSVSTRHYFAFGALVSEELSFKIKELPGVRWVLPDSYLDVRNKDYGGEPFINGEAVPYDPKYHAEWVRNNARANERNHRNNRPRDRADRSRNFERRNMQENTGGNPYRGAPQNMGGMASNNAPNQGGAPYQSAPGPNYAPNMAGGNPNQNNMRGMPNNSPNAQYGNAPNSVAPYPPGHGPNQHGYAPNMAGGSTYQNSNSGGIPNHAPNPQYGNGQYGNGPYGGAQYQSGPGPNQNSYAPNMAGGNAYQNQNMPGRDNQ